MVTSAGFGAEKLLVEMDEVYPEFFGHVLGENFKYWRVYTSVCSVMASEDLIPGQLVCQSAVGSIEATNVEGSWINFETSLPLGLVFEEITGEIIEDD